MPNWRPVTLKQAKHQVGLPNDVREFDDQLNRLILTAQETVEKDQSRVSQAGTFDWKLDCFPMYGEIRLPYRNVTGPVTVSYTDTSGDPQTFTDFTFSASRVYPVIAPNNTIWPTAQAGTLDVVTITFDAGWDSVDLVPSEMIETMLAIISSLFSGCDVENFGPAYQALSNRQVATYL